MQDRELYQHILGLTEPWTVGRIELSVSEQEVNVWVEHPKGLPWTCPKCQALLPLYDHAEERAWRHLDSCAYQTYLHARVPRVDCPEDGVLQVKVPWAEPSSRFTLLFERFAIDVLRQCDVTGATQILRISWDEAWRIMERAVERGKRRKEKKIVSHIGVDEKAIAKGQQYMTLVCDIKEGTIDYIAKDRKQESLAQYYQQLSTEQKAGIEAVGLDMWDPFVKATRDYVPDGDNKMVYDRFHIMSHVGKAVDLVRKQEHRELLKQGCETLKGSKYLWLYREENIPEKQRARFIQLKGLELKVGRAWAVKEALRNLWDFASKESAGKFWKRWYFWATHTRLKPVCDVAKMMKRHVKNIMSYFQHRITNAVSEGLNNKIQSIKKAAYGFRNYGHFKTAILFHCGGLNLYPC